MRTLDEVDIKILNQLKKNARMPLYLLYHVYAAIAPLLISR